MTEKYTMCSRCVQCMYKCMYEWMCVGGHTFPGTFLVFPSSMDRKSSNDMTPSPSTSAACKRAVAVRESIIYIHTCIMIRYKITIVAIYYAASYGRRCVPGDRGRIVNLPSWESQTLRRKVLRIRRTRRRPAACCRRRIPRRAGRIPWKPPPPGRS